MRASLFASALLFLAGAASAADLPPPVTAGPPPMLAPEPLAYSWSGFYFGAHGGYGFSNDAFDNGAVAGAHVGVNWQYGRFVVGFEGGGSWLDWNGLNAQSTLLGRGGFAYGRLLAYGTAGLSIQEIKTLVGWVAGAGVEFAITDRWAVGLEYLHYDYAADDSDVVRAKVNYLFGKGAGRYGDDVTGAGIFDEVRLGAFGFVQKNASSEEGLYLTGELFFDPFISPLDNRFLDVILRPRPHIGGTISPTGTDLVFAGVAWNVPLGRMFFVEPAVAWAFHNGPIAGAQVSLDCHGLVRKALGVGANIGRHWRIVASAARTSEPIMCADGDGLTHVGASIGYRF